MNPLKEIRARFAPLLEQLQVNPTEYLGQIRPAQDAKFGDYQANFCMPLAGKLKRNSRELAAELTGQLELGGLCEPAEIAGPGFINLRLADDWLKGRLQSALSDPHSTLLRMSPSRCTSAIFVRRSSAIHCPRSFASSVIKWLRTTTWGTGVPNSE
ncbi:MAG: hypothetical protein LW697_06575 [Blastopirellula sp.]|nr:hypothetical protein [Blastopirellula sp.]